MKKLMVVSNFALALVLAGCTSNRERQLQADIDALNIHLNSLEGQITNELPELSAKSSDMVVRSGYNPVIAWGNRFQSAPLAQRTITFEPSSSSGYLYHTSPDCPIPFLPDGDIFAEITGDSTRAQLAIDSFPVVPTANGLVVTPELQLHAETRVHAHVKLPCAPGGGAGTTIFATADKHLDTNFVFKFLPSSSEGAPYTIDLVSPQSVNVTVLFHFQHLPSLPVTFEMTDLAKQISSGTIMLLVKSGGQMGPLPDGQVYTYTITNEHPELTSDQAGIWINSDVRVKVVSQ